MKNTRLPDAKEEKLKQKTAELLEADRVRLLLDQPFIGAILIRQNLVPVVDFRCPTASTDGQNIFVNPEFVLALTPQQRRFLLAHEVWHTVYLHFLRRGKRDQELFNIACDMEVNAMLEKEHFKAPDGAVLPPDAWRGLNAEAIYEKLKRQKQSFSEAQFDCHLECDKGSASNQNDNFDEDSRREDVSAETIVIDPDYQVDFGDNPEDSAREKVVEAAVQYEKKRGSLPAHIARIAEDFRAGKLSWKELLHQFVTSCFGGSRRWLPPNRRYISSGLYLQSRRDTRLQAVLAIDTSASTKADLPQFAAEFVNLLNSFGQYDLTVICCDCQVQSVKTYSQENPFNGRKIRFSGGGGTAFAPVFEYVKKNIQDVQLLIYFTDGYGDQPAKPPYPVMWIITPDGKNSIPWGYEINLD